MAYLISVFSVYTKLETVSEVTTEGVNTELCSLACDVAMETCSSQSHETCGECGIDVTD